MKPDKKFCGTDGNILKLWRKHYEEIRYKNNTTKETIYITDGLRLCLRKKLAIQTYGLALWNLKIFTVDQKLGVPGLFRNLVQLD